MYSIFNVQITTLKSNEQSKQVHIDDEGESFDWDLDFLNPIPVSQDSWKCSQFSPIELYILFKKMHRSLKKDLQTNTWACHKRIIVHLNFAVTDMDLSANGFITENP